MLFNSLYFLLFFLAVCVVYYITPQRFQWITLLAASIGFYLCFHPLHVVILLFIAAVSYWTGMLVFESEKEKAKKVLLASGTVLSLLFLLLGKYADFILDNMYVLLDAAKIPYTTSNIRFILPVGISFYSFKAVSYVVDAYRGKIVEKSFLKYLLYISFFPQIASGPIERSTSLLPQLDQEHRFDPQAAESGLCLMLVGYFKKMVVADNLAEIVSKAFSDAEMYSPLLLFFIACVYSIQIYCDFSGYSDIAIGCARVLGIRTAPNFDHPYSAKSIRDFWKRWHISLSSWFMDYLYIPLGGNRKGKVRKCINLMIVFLVSGLWHGAAWNFVFWGFLHGAYQIIGTLTAESRRKLSALLHIDRHEKLRDLLSVAVTFVLVTFAWIFFKADTIGDGFRYIQCMLFNHGGGFSARALISDIKMLFQLKATLITFIVAIGSYILFALIDRKADFCRFMGGRRTVTKFVLYTLFISFIIVFASTNVADFIYLRF
ncbi:MAG: MBOAT family protein [Oscillospiraceae bacterium]|nr:MBOAT family protein [Oscillospiraceae bacterium]